MIEKVPERRCGSNPGHNDLLAGNFIDDGKRLWLIDWEDGGFGTAMFDLANLATNGSFAPADDRLLLQAYFRQPVRPACGVRPPRSSFAAVAPSPAVM